MPRLTSVSATLLTVAALSLVVLTLHSADTPPGAAVQTHQNAFADYRSQAPGVTRKITVADLPKPFATPSAMNQARVVPRPADAWPGPGKPLFGADGKGCWRSMTVLWLILPPVCCRRHYGR